MGIEIEVARAGISCILCDGCVMPGKNHDKEQEMPTLTLEVSSGRPEGFGPLVGRMIDLNGGGLVVCLCA